MVYLIVIKLQKDNDKWFNSKNKLTNAYRKYNPQDA